LKCPNELNIFLTDYLWQRKEAWPEVGAYTDRFSPTHRYNADMAKLRITLKGVYLKEKITISALKRAKIDQDRSF